MRTNTYDAARNRVTLNDDRAAAFQQLAAYYTDVFATGRTEYAIPQRRADERRKAKADGGILLVDFVGGEHGSAGFDDDLYEQLAA